MSLDSNGRIGPRRLLPIPALDNRSAKVTTLPGFHRRVNNQLEKKRNRSRKKRKECEQQHESHNLSTRLTGT
eukprot:327326-Amphidinium_carterae.2